MDGLGAWPREEEDFGEKEGKTLEENLAQGWRRGRMKGLRCPFSTSSTMPSLPVGPRGANQSLLLENGKDQMEEKPRN